MEPRPPPLAGVRVLDFGQVYQGPYAGFLMAKAGADVSKIEPPHGEPLRAREAVGGGASLPLAMLYYRQGRFAEAEQWVGVALERRSDDVRVANLAGWIALDGGDAARALSRFDGALAHAADVVEGGGRHARARAAAVDGARLGRAQATAALAAASGGGVRP